MEIVQTFAYNFVYSYRYLPTLLLTERKKGNLLKGIPFIFQTQAAFLCYILKYVYFCSFSPLPEYFNVDTF